MLAGVILGIAALWLFGQFGQIACAQGPQCGLSNTGAGAAGLMWLGIALVLVVSRAGMRDQRRWPWLWPVLAIAAITAVALLGVAVFVIAP